jgi:hypothetical protein
VPAASGHRAGRYRHGMKERLRPRDSSRAIGSVLSPCLGQCRCRRPLIRWPSSTGECSRCATAAPAPSGPSCSHRSRSPSDPTGYPRSPTAAPRRQCMDPPSIPSGGIDLRTARSSELVTGQPGQTSRRITRRRYDSNLEVMPIGRISDRGMGTRWAERPQLRAP